MSPAEIALTALELGAKLGPDVARGFEAVLRDHRPELLPPPPPRQDDAIRAEDEDKIAKKFPRS